MRCLNAFFSTAPQVTGLAVVTDLYPFHLQARMVQRTIHLRTSHSLHDVSVEHMDYGFLDVSVLIALSLQLPCCSCQASAYTHRTTFTPADMNTAVGDGPTASAAYTE